jgi:hypothetical protein
VNHLDYWVEAMNKIIDGRQSEVDLRAFYNKSPFKSANEVPFSMFPRELLRDFPNCKFIVSTRDPERWSE